MNDRDELLVLLTGLLQRADDRELRFIYVLLNTMLNERGTA